MRGESILRTPALWLGVAASIGCAVGVGIRRTPSGPPWWTAGLGFCALALALGVAMATLRLFGGESARSLWSRLNVRYLLSSVTLLLLGLGFVLAAQERSGIVETMKGTCFMYGGVVLPGTVLSGLIRFLTDRVDLAVRWAIFSMCVFFGVFVVGLALGAGKEEVERGAANRFAGVVLISKGLLGLTEMSTPVSTGLGWLGITGIVACCAVLGRSGEK